MTVMSMHNFFPYVVTNTTVMALLKVQYQIVGGGELWPECSRGLDPKNCN